MNSHQVTPLAMVWVCNFYFNLLGAAEEKGNKGQSRWQSDTETRRRGIFAFPAIVNKRERLCYVLSVCIIMHANGRLPEATAAYNSFQKAAH